MYVSVYITDLPRRTQWCACMYACACEYARARACVCVCVCGRVHMFTFVCFDLVSQGQSFLWPKMCGRWSVGNLLVCFSWSLYPFLEKKNNLQNNKTEAVWCALNMLFNFLCVFLYLFLFVCVFHLNLYLAIILVTFYLPWTRHMFSCSIRKETIV